MLGTGDIFGECLYYGDQYITLTAEPDQDSYLLGIFDVPDNNLVSRLSPHAFTMPFEDIQYLARFRPNPYIVINQKYIDENGNEVWGLKCSEDTVIKLHEDLEESFIFSQLCQILPQKLLEEGGLQSLKDSASDLIAKRDDPEVTITMADIAAIGDGVFVDFDDESLE